MTKKTCHVIIDYSGLISHGAACAPSVRHSLMTIARLCPYLLVASLFACSQNAGNIEALSLETRIPKETIQIISRHGTNLRQLRGLNQEGKEYLAHGVTIDVDPDQSFSLVRRLQPILGKNFIVFVSERNFGIGGKADLLSVIQSVDQFEALTIMNTNGWNYGIGPEKVIGKLKEWDIRYGLTIVGAGFDWVQADFKKRPKPMLPFAEEVFKFCPDDVYQGAGTVEHLATEMESSNSLYMWWD
jgi:hypothetical protein